MSYSYNRATLVGRLSKDPEIKEFADSKSKTSFTLAVSRTYRKDAGTTDTDFIPICFWGKTAEISFQLLRKGTPVLVWGRIQVRSYEKDNDTRWMTEIMGDNFQVLEKVRIEPEKVSKK